MQCLGLGLLLLRLLLLFLLQLRDALCQGSEGSLTFPEFLIPGQLRFQGAKLPVQLFLPGRFFLFCLQGLLGGLHPGQQLLPLPAGLCQLFPGLLGLLRLAQQRGGLLELLCQAVQRLLLLRLLRPVLGDQLFHQLHGLLEGQLPRLGLLQLGLGQVILLTDDAADVLLHTGPGSLTVSLELSRFALHSFLEHHIVPGLEDLPEDLLAAPGVRQQQLEEIPLGDHGDLGKLAAAQADDPDDLSVHLPGLGHQAAVREGQLRVRLLDGGAAALFGQPFIFRVPADRIGLSAVGKDQLHLRGGLRPGVLGAEHGWVPVVAAGLPVEGVGDGVKDGGLAGAGVSGDEVESLLPQLLQVHDHPARIGAEGGYCQFQRSHASSSSQIRSIHARAKLRCSWPMG